MNKSGINSLLKEINDLVVKIQNKKEKIKELQEINLKKNTSNYNKYISRIEELDKTEQAIKSLMENKYFKYIKHIDFLEESDVKELKGFSLNKDLGCILKTEESKQLISHLNRIVSTDNKKITYIYNTDPEVSNLLEYSFYNAETGVPLIPSSIKITYKENEDNFYEPHFRFYNRNNTTSFVNSFPFQPKRISKITFEFNEKINTNNAKCNLYSVIYSMLEENSVLIEVKNINQLNAFNFSRKSEESMVPLMYSYSEDNMEFKDITFENTEESLITLENNGDFYIKISADNENIKILEEKTVKTSELYSQELENSFGVYSIPANITTSLSNIKITFPISSYNKLKKSMESLNDINIDEFITKQENGLYVLNNEYINYVATIDEKINNLKYIDDISILETDKKYFTVYADTNNMKIHFSSFIQEFNFFIEIQYQSISEQIDKTYYTPYLFSISLKG